MSDSSWDFPGFICVIAILAVGWWTGRHPAAPPEVDRRRSRSSHRSHDGSDPLSLRSILRDEFISQIFLFHGEGPSDIAFLHPPMF
jgi:hypothetical protein